jgi:hypothetical protein
MSSLRLRRMLPNRVRFGAGLVFAVALVAAFSVSASPAMATEIQSCRLGSLEMGSCTFLIYPNNTVIDYLQGEGYNGNPITMDNMHIELTGPRGHILNCPQVNIGPYGTTPICQWSPFDARAPGSYCSILWYEESPTDYIEYSSACVGFP